MQTTLPHSLTTAELAGELDDPRLSVVDVCDMAAFNGWKLHGVARGGHIRDAVAFPLGWTRRVTGQTLHILLTSKGMTMDKTIVVYDVHRDRSTVMAHIRRALGYNKILIYDAGVRAWAADTSLPMGSLARYDMLVYPAWVYQLLCGRCPKTYAGHGFAVFEVGWGEGTAYHAGHIPGARYFALQEHEHPPWWNRVSAATCEAQLLAQGIRHDTTVVLYGRDMTAAARVAVLLMYAGVHDVRLLDGGLAAWRAAGYAVETMQHRPVLVQDFGKTIPGRSEYIIDTEDAKALLADADAALVCVRSWAEYVGATSGYPYTKAKGRIVGALWGHAGAVPRRMDHYRNVDNTMRNYHEIAANWRSWGVTSDKRVAFYCGTGWHASEAFFSAYLMGWKQVAVYDGGWWEWSQNTSNPIACGDPSR